MRSSRPLFAFGSLVALSTVTACSSSEARLAEAVSPPNALKCAGLVGRTVESGRIVKAEHFARGSKLSGGATPDAVAAVDMCRVSMLLRPAPTSSINVEVWLPEKWNQRLLGLGGGGFDGSLSPGAAPHLGKAVEQGYAAVVTDVGHPASAPAESWVHRQPERVVDFGHRGQHLAAVTAKQAIAYYYGRRQQTSVFIGCSNGGRDGLVLAQRYPADYDAIVAGAPARKYTETVTQLVWNSRSVGTASEAAALTAKLPMVNKAILKKCDRLDGVEDGILENPRMCRFDPAELQCPATQGDRCLSAQEVGALKRVYAGAQFSDGRSIYGGPALGSEGNPGNWGAWVTGPVPAIAGQEFYRWMVRDEPKWSIADFDMDRDYRLAKERVAPIINVDEPDLRAFAARGGKLLIYQGWDDPAITPEGTISYFEGASRQLGARAARTLRLYMVPGMAHCGGGPGATSFDMQSALESWLDTGVAPERIAARNPGAVAEPFSRPLCPWPQTARYKGTGSTRDEANFVCRR